MSGGPRFLRSLRRRRRPGWRSRLPDDVARGLEDLAAAIERPKSYVMRKAIEEYLREYADYLIALERLNDKDDAIVSDAKMRKLLGIQD